MNIVFKLLMEKGISKADAVDRVLDKAEERLDEEGKLEKIVQVPAEPVEGFEEIWPDLTLRERLMALIISDKPIAKKKAKKKAKKAVKGTAQTPAETPDEDK